MNSIFLGLQNHQLSTLKFNLILKEMQELLSTFKDLVEKCLVESDANHEDGIVLGIDLSRAFEKDPNSVWRCGESEEIDSMFGSSLDEKSAIETEEFEHEEEQENDLMLQIS